MSASTSTSSQYCQICKWLFASALALLMVGCSSAPKIHSLYEQGVDFNQYQTFAFAESMNPQGEEYLTLVDKYLRQAIREELLARGLRESAAAQESDLMVAYHVQTRDKTEVYSRPRLHTGYYGYRGFHGYTYGMGYGTDIRTRHYTEGTLNIDVVDRSQKQLIWEGVAVGRLQEINNETLESEINKVVARIFKHYPLP